MKVEKINILKIAIFSVLLLLIFVNGCGLNEPEEIIKPARLRIFFKFSTDSYQLTDSDSLYLQAQDFKIYKDTNFADVFQNPNQFIPFRDSIVNFNMLKATLADTMIQVAYGSIPPLNYDSLKFLLAPGNQMRLGNNIYPISTDYSQLEGDVQFSTVVKITSKIKTIEDRTVNLIINFKAEDVVFRYLDRFIFNAKVDSFYFSN